MQDSFTGEELDFTTGSFAMDIFDSMLSEVMDSSAEGRDSGIWRSSEGSRIRFLLESNSDLRREFLSVLYATRARLTGDDNYGDNIRMGIPEASTHPRWELESLGGEVDNNWIWEGLVADTDETADTDFLQHSETVRRFGACTEMFLTYVKG